MSAERIVWYFYKIRWGCQDEFLELFKKNHYPVLKAQIGGRFTAVRAWVPKYHGDGRADWTFVVAITYRDADALVAPSRDAEVARQLFPDQERFRQEEQRRFELVKAHWDVLLKDVTLDEG